MGIWIRKRAQQGRGVNTEDCLCCTNANCERKHADDSESSVLSELAEAVAHVLPARLQKGFPASGADHFLGDFKAPLLQTYRAKGILTAHSLFHLFFRCHLHENSQLFVQLRFDPFLSEQRSETARHASEE